MMQVNGIKIGEELSINIQHEKGASTKVQVSNHFGANIAIIFLTIGQSICFRHSKEPAHGDGAFEYPQHMFWMKNKKENF